jgi:PAS domain S-box-containing protein
LWVDVLESIGKRAAVVDNEGRIVAVNAAWTEFAANQAPPFSPEIGMPGANYLEACRHAAAAGSSAAGEMLAGLDDVLHGREQAFETVYAGGAPGESRWYRTTVTRLRRNDGAVIVVSEFTPPALAALARSAGTAAFENLADALPVPVWTASPDGSLQYANDRWMEANKGRDRTASDLKWFDAFHPDDRKSIASAFAHRVRRPGHFQIEARMRARDGGYRWSVCCAAPRYAADGRLEAFVGVCWDASEKRRAESTLNQVANKLVAAQETERSRIARELHDDLGQQVAVLASKLEAISHTRSRSHELKTKMADARRSLQEIATSIHNLSHELHPAKLRLLGLVQTLRALARDESSRAGVDVRFEADDVPQNVPQDLALCIFRVTQEALQNALKHSGATTIDVRLEGAPAHLMLRVADNGTGFEPLRSQNPGLGLLTMRERVELAGGTLTIEPGSPTGTVVRVWLPFEAQRETPTPPPTSGDAAPRPVSAPDPLRTPGSSVSDPESTG